MRYTARARCSETAGRYARRGLPCASRLRVEAALDPFVSNTGKGAVSPLLFEIMRMIRL